jgi:CelD/BcsL family acetyltransferase involved in cellulose biosynthesis
VDKNESIQVSLTPLSDLESLGRTWRDLEQRSSHSYFTSWSWIGAWLAHLPPTATPQILTATRAGHLVGLAVLLRRRLRMKRIFVSHGLFLNETGDPYYDQLTIEHNGILAERGLGAAVTRRALEYLVTDDREWDEFFLRRLDTLEGFDGVPRRKARVVEDERWTSYCVDLERLRSQGKDYLSALSANTRQKIRRAIRDYEREGPIRIDVARGTDEAMAFLDGLIAYHQPYWIKKGFPGSFANPFFTQFHRDLIHSRLAFGETQLMRVSAGDRPIGYLYNLVKDGQVYNYQSGFYYEQNKNRRPGFLCHYAAVMHNFEQGMNCYDFMAGGDAQYKASLSTHQTEMIWAIVRRTKVKFRIRETLRYLKRKLATPSLATG